MAAISPPTIPMVGAFPGCPSVITPAGVLAANVPGGRVTWFPFSGAPDVTTSGHTVARSAFRAAELLWGQPIAGGTAEAFRTQE